MSFQKIYSSAMHKLEIDTAQTERIVQNCIKKKEQVKSVTPSLRWAAVLSMAAILVIVLTLSLFIGQEGQLPLGIRVYAKDENGALCQVLLKEGERVYMEPGAAEWATDISGQQWKGYCVEMLQDESTYLCVYVTDKDGVYVGNKYVHMYGEAHWVYTEGDEIPYIYPDPNIPKYKGYVAEGYPEGKWQPEYRGNKFVWIPNDYGQNYIAIECYNSDFVWICTYYLSIGQDEAGYYSEITHVV